AYHLLLWFCRGLGVILPRHLLLVRDGGKPGQICIRRRSDAQLLYYLSGLRENGKHTIGAHFSRVCCLLEETSSTRVTVELMDGGRDKMRIQLTIDINGEAGDVGKLVP